tara:strand:+ start:875 stop:1297 length:423 start_codon:yes stop_codon:yes gene_type:complete
MDTCKANKCIRNKDISYDGVGRCQYNDFKRCSKKVYKDGFCKRCYEPDKRINNKNWIPDQLWKRDGIYGEPYDFPYHKTKKEREWVEMIHTVQPHIRPIQKDTIKKETAEEKIAKIIVWLDNNSDKINYKLGSELKELLT